ncbi:MAG: signal peptidase I [Candidatus Dormibacteraeota bacterium]|nr:signal peptidase I [Candidatus Dormibacteraeota bacterium]
MTSLYEPVVDAPAQPKQKSFLRDLLEVVVLALVLYVLIQFAVQTIHVMGPSMQNTLQNNDFLIASKVSYRLHDPQRGDIIIFKPNNDASNDYIKRIIAGPNDRLKISKGQVSINGRRLNEDYLPETWTSSDTWNNGNQDTVPADSYFVMGDNRNHSTDSRFLGYQKKDQFLGKAWVRIWPLSQFRVFSPDSQLASAN